MHGDESQESLSQSMRGDIARFAACESDDEPPRGLFGRFRGPMARQRREMDCEEFRGLIPLALRGKLRWRRRRRFWEHSGSCESCRRDFQRADSVWEEQQAPAGESVCFGERPIVRIASIILTRAIEAGAQEVWIEPSDEGISVIARTAEESRQLMPLPGCIGIPLTARFKAMANVDLTEWNVPQEGVLSFTHGGRDYRARITFEPSAYIEKTTMHLL